MNLLSKLANVIKYKALIVLLPICLGLMLAPSTSYSQCATCYAIAAELEKIQESVDEEMAAQEENDESNKQDADTADATKSWKQTIWGMVKKFKGLIAVLAVTGIIEIINTQTKQTHKGKAMDAFKGKNKDTQSPKSFHKVYGSKSAFANMVNAYKQGDKTCHKAKGSGKKKCYSNINSGTMHNHTKFQNKGHEKAAKQYSHNASGAAIGIAKPKNKSKKVTPSTVQYNAYYKTQAASGSSSTNDMSGSIGERQTLNHNGKKKSSASHRKKSNQTTVQENASKMSNAPVVGPVYTISTNVQKANTQMHKEGKHLDKINNSANTTNTHFSHANHQAFGKQLHNDAQNASEGEPHKRHPHQ